MAGFDPGGLDPVIHGRLRLAVMAYLSAVNPATFAELAQRTQATHGNLSTHLTKLEEAGYVRLEKGFAGKRPQTLARLTETGREAWIAYLDALHGLIGAPPPDPEGEDRKDTS